MDEGNAYLFAASPVSAGPYLHIAFSMLWIEKHGGLDFFRPELKKKILKRIDVLADSGGIPAAESGIKLGWDRRGKQFSFGGYATDADEDSCEIMEAMYRVQLCAYHKNIANDASELLCSFQTDLAKFDSEISYTHDYTSYYHLPVFHLIVLDNFAKATLKYLQIRRSEELGKVFEKIAERHSESRDWEVEKQWFKTIRGILKERAAHYSKLATAQLDLFFYWYWKFVETEMSAAKPVVIDALQGATIIGEEPRERQ